MLLAGCHNTMSGNVEESKIINNTNNLKIYYKSSLWKRKFLLGVLVVEDSLGLFKALALLGVNPEIKKIDYSFNYFTKIIINYLPEILKLIEVITNCLLCSNIFRCPFSAAELSFRPLGVLGVLGEAATVSSCSNTPLYASGLKSGPKNVFPTTLNTWGLDGTDIALGELHSSGLNCGNEENFISKLTCSKTRSIPSSIFFLKKLRLADGDTGISSVASSTKSESLSGNCLLCKGALPNCAGVGARTNGFSSISFFDTLELSSLKSNIIGELFSLESAYCDFSKDIRFSSLSALITISGSRTYFVFMTNGLF
ncbi:hypothetical protein AGLY_011627 [Aphis glycines]|uniref:Uncharacterized protein n=1 Tax=Aphis glycines TaxID=307491 RepID=A0A6G0TBC5_APHGL|nr:hypothetical protein AGLY_011627 [Aphis glycines]